MVQTEPGHSPSNVGMADSPSNMELQTMEVSMMGKAIHDQHMKPAELCLMGLVLNC